MRFSPLDWFRNGKRSSEEEYNWQEIFRRGQQIKIEEEGYICGGIVFDAPQVVEIVGTYGTDPDGDWPLTVTLRGTLWPQGVVHEVEIDNLFVRDGIKRGDGIPLSQNQETTFSEVEVTN